MGTLRLIYLVAAFQSISAVLFDHENHQKMDTIENRENIEREGYETEFLGLLRDSASTTIVSRDRRDNSADLMIGSHSSPPRHSKHRRRRRCKNRDPTCPLTLTSPRQRFPLRSYDDTDDLYPSFIVKNDKQIPTVTEPAVTSSTSFKHIGERLKQPTVVNVTANDNIHDKENNQRVQIQSTDVSTSILIDENPNLSSDYTTNGKTPPDATSRWKTLMTQDESTLFDSSKFGNIDIYDENDFKDVDVSSWSSAAKSSADKTTLKKREHINIYDTSLSSYISTSPDSHFTFHEGPPVLLTRLFQMLRNISTRDSRDILKELNFIVNTDVDPCQKWLDSWDKFEEVFLDSLIGLPACPCQYPSDIFYEDKIWDENQQKYFRWRDVSSDSQRLDVYKPGATYCIRSLVAQGSESAAAQHCCYDHKRRLLIRGSGAGTPNFISPEVSTVLHEKIDILPWRLCKGDFSRFNKARPPNNDNNCEINPDDEEYQRQIDNTKYY